MIVARMMRMVVLGGLVAGAALVGCGDSGGGSDGDTQVADGADAVQSDVVVPGPGECELNWVTGFTPFLGGVEHREWPYLEPNQAGEVYFHYGFLDGGPDSVVRVDIETCRVMDREFQFRAKSEDNEVLYTLTVNVPNYPGLGSWQLGAADELDVQLVLEAANGTSYMFVANSTASSGCEICVDATGRQGAFRCDSLVAEDGGERGGIAFAGFICPEDEPGFLP